MEPWDGPAAIAFTDGTRDRRDARPQRPAARRAGWRPTTAWWCWPRRAGVLDDPAARSCARGGCSRASCSWSTSAQGRIVADDEIKRELAAPPALRRLVRRSSVVHFDRPARAPPRVAARSSRCARASCAFGYTQEDISVILAPMARDGRGADRLDGHRHRRWRCSLTSAPLLFNYFKQLFAQVTNPPIDPIREEIVMSLGAERRRASATCSRRRPSTPTSSCSTSRSCATANWRAAPRSTHDDLPAAHDRHHLAGRRAGRRHGARARAHLREAHDGDRRGVNILILSDRDLGAERAPIPALLAVAAVHHHLVARGHAAAGRPRGRDRRAPRGPPLRHAGRLRRRGGQPVPDARDARRARSRDGLLGAAASPRGGRRRSYVKAIARAC